MANLMHFARFLRATGLPIGPGRVIEGIRAIEAVGLGRRDDFYWALHSVFVNRNDQRELFEQAFREFWREPSEGMRPPADVLSESRIDLGRPAAETSRRVREARRLEPHPHPPSEVERPASIDLVMTWSDREILQTKDFEEMSAEEVERAREIIARMRLPIADVRTRRFRGDPRGARVDMRATLRASVRSGGSGIPLRWRAPRMRPPPLVALCDISGSMSRYSRMLLHFLHTLTNDRDRVHSFLFGTRLTNVTRHLRARDVDVSLARVADAVEDWSGGTRIGACLEAFNRLWSRRVLAQGAVVLLITDGLDRDAGRGLEREMERLHKSCRRLIWLNPLLRYEGFEPLAGGVKVMLPHVDDFRPVHNLESLEALAGALAE